MLTITSHVNKCKENGAPAEIEKCDFNSNETMPVNQYKKYVVLCARIHPGESNSSYIMQGLIDYLTGNSPEAIDLRRKIVFKILPMTNPDGVIAGNYRTSLSGNDLNRQFMHPNIKLHPEVIALRSLISAITIKAKE